MLTQKQTAAADALLQRRPGVIPGTRVIPNDSMREGWYLDVADTMRDIGVCGDAIAEFCDRAGVPD